MAIEGEIRSTAASQANAEPTVTLSIQAGMPAPTLPQSSILSTVKEKVEGGVSGFIDRIADRSKVTAVFHKIVDWFHYNPIGRKIKAVALAFLSLVAALVAVKGLFFAISTAWTGIGFVAGAAVGIGFGYIAKRFLDEAVDLWDKPPPPRPVSA